MNLLKFYANSLMQDITAFGTVYHLLVLVIVLLAFGFHDLVYKLVAGQMIMYVTATPMKLYLFKDRPRRMKHKNLIEKIEASSFPSVHTLRVFFVSTVLAATFQSIPLTYILAALSVLVGYSRLYLKKHHVTDVAAGAIFGIALGYGVVNYV